MPGWVHVSPEGVEGDTVRATVPVNPVVLDTTTVMVPAEPTSTRGGVAVVVAIRKSAEVKVTVLECGPAEIDVPVIVTEYVPLGPLHERLAVPEPPTMIVGLREQERLEEKLAAKVTSSSNPPLELTVIGISPKVPTGIATLAGTDIMKSLPNTVTETITE